MTIRSMQVERRIHGTLNGAEEFHCHYKVAPNEETAPLTADFTAAAVVVAAGGTPSPTVFGNVIGALQLYGRGLLSSSASNDEQAIITSDGAGSYNIRFRTIPPVGAGVPPVDYALQAVKDAPGAPSGADFDAVIAAFESFGDGASS